MKHSLLCIGLLFCFSIISTLCFANNNTGLNWTPEISLPKDYFTTQPIFLALKSNHPILYKFNQRNLVNDEIISEDVSYGKQIGICGLEFLGAEVSAIPILYWAGYGSSQTGEIDPSIYYYVFSNIAITSTFCWGTGELLNQNGSWYKTAIGTAVGTLVGSIFAYKSIKYGGRDGYTTYIAFIAPALGAVIGYNF